MSEEDGQQWDKAKPMPAEANTNLHKLLSKGTGLVTQFPSALQLHDNKGSITMGKSSIGNSGTGSVSLEGRIIKLEQVAMKQQEMHESMQLEMNTILGREEHLQRAVLDLERRLFTSESANHAAVLGAISFPDCQEQLKSMQETNEKIVQRLEILEGGRTASSREDDSQGEDVRQPIGRPDLSGGEVQILEDIRKELADIRRWQTDTEDRLAQACSDHAQKTSDESWPGPSAEPEPETHHSKRTSQHSLHRLFKENECHREYEWTSSVYDSMMFVGVPGYLTTISSAFIVLGFCIHLALTSIICYIISTDDFRDNRYDDTALEAYRNWRSFDAHSFANADPLTGMSLVTRVCGVDRGLSVAREQAALIDEVDRYFFNNQGRVLCNVAVVLWVCCCAQEIRQTILFAAGVCNLCQTERTSVLLGEGGTIESISVWKGRIVLGLAIAAVRFFFACCLIVFGCTWLSRTVSIENLLVNTSALGFVMDIDNTIFGVFAPHHVQGLIRSLKPMICHKLVLADRPTLSAALSLGIVGYVFFVNFHEIDTVVHQMDLVKAALCDPIDSHPFVVATNPLGWVTLVTDTPSLESQDIQLIKDSPQGNILQRLIRTPKEFEKYTLQLNTVEQLRVISQQHPATYVNSFYCQDLNTLKDEKEATVGTRLSAITGDPLFPHMTTCEDIKLYCNHTDWGKVGASVRLMCPETCGCSSSTSGMYDLGQAEYGCPQTHCKKKLLRSMRGVICEDYSLESLKSTGWSHMLHRMKSLGDINEAIGNNLTKLGCDALSYLPGWKIFDLCTHSPLAPKVGLSPFCPVACKCSNAVSIGSKENCPNVCPESCCI